MSYRIQIFKFFNNLSLTKKILLLAAISSLLVWLSMDYFVRVTIEKAFFSQMLITLEEKSKDNRFRFRRQIDAYYQAAQLFTLQKNFAEYVKKQQWHAPAEDFQVKFHSRSPAWFVSHSLLRNFINPRYAFLLDSSGKIREVYQSTSDKPPEFLLQLDAWILQLIQDDFYIRHIEGIPYLLTAKSLQDDKGENLATLVLASPFDKTFLVAAQGVIKDNSIMVLVSGEQDEIVASSDLNLAPKGKILDELRGDYIIIKQQNLDYGNSEINFKFTSLIAKSLVQPQIDAVVNQARLRHTILALVLITVFALIIIWITKRIGNLTGQVNRLSERYRDEQFVDVDKQETAVLHSISEKKVVDDEIGSLVSGFNHMLQAINQRDKEVQSLNQLLKLRAIDLNNSLEQLKKTQKQMVESEKMASLGSLVAGVAHEINTPIGVSISGASFLYSRTEGILQEYSEHGLTKKDFDEYTEEAITLLKIIVDNLEHAGKLIGSFKQVAVDQSSQNWGVIDVESYLDEVLISLHPKYKHLMDNITIDCSGPLYLYTNPGSLAQIITNLVINSVEHGFPENNMQTKPSISLQLRKSEESGKKICHLQYRDNGCGMNEELLAKIYEPFYTTRRAEGGSGLGMAIVYNLLTQQLGGGIQCQSQPGQGTTFIMTLMDMEENIKSEKVAGIVLNV